MKKMITFLALSLCALVSANAMSYEQAREEARFLTDKMAYELNLNDQQYNDAYEINLDYLLSVRSERDLYGDYLAYRNADLRHILYDWQYSLFCAADYFFRPLTWFSGAWYLPVYRYYRVGHYYYHHPTVFYSYRGGHGRYYHHGGYYASRRPHWSGGFRGYDRTGISHRGRGGSYHHSSQRGSSYGRNNGYRNQSGYSIGRSVSGGSHDSRSHGNSSYGHPSSTRSTVNRGTSTSSYGGSRPNGFSIGNSRSTSGSNTTINGSRGNSRSSVSSSSYGGSRPSSFSSGSTRSGASVSSSRSGASVGSSRSSSHSSHSGSSRGGGRGR